VGYGHPAGGLSFTDDSGAKPTALPPDLGTALLVVEFPPLDPAEEANDAIPGPVTGEV
jgi:hypothetical protein